jgi:hypothetical protein
MEMCFLCVFFPLFSLVLFVKFVVN